MNPAEIMAWAVAVLVVVVCGCLAVIAVKSAIRIWKDKG